MECQCETCQKACAYRPGRFLPGEVEIAAAHFGMTPLQFFQEKLAMDWWVEYPQDIYFPAPALVNEPTGDRYPSSPQGRCSLFMGGKCSIHEVKPFECRDWYHGSSDEENKIRVDKLVEAWRDPALQATMQEWLDAEP